ncbi:MULTISPECIES: hypothetical protein [Photorhabdus]|uniref:Uncharacterized protein n=2 Tax=Photorhabdus TaxID=29487 RepID=A0AAW6BPT6_9GAMM|nr:MULTISPECIES: hypothetical protein [Photorhabdus]EYU16574.1 hypothetical protein BA1DRAFT_00858 [Photorhabdus aegyptia]MDB6373875.1 hypothetical protein [Photorhabdus bodei]
MNSLIQQLINTKADFTVTGNRVIVHSDLAVCRYRLNLQENYLKVDELPDELIVEGSLYIGSGIRTLPATLVVGKNLYKER